MLISGEEHSILNDLLETYGNNAEWIKNEDDTYILKINDDDAEILSQKHKSRLKDVDLKTMTVDNGSNGIFHRIVSVPLPREDADEVCSILRRSGQDCFLRKYETTTP